MKAPIPILRIFDEAKAREFYLDFLGFHLDWAHRFEDNFPVFMQISSGACVLNLSEHHGDACPGAAVRIEIDPLDDYNQALLDKKYKYARPGIQVQPWGMREMTITDPFGNRLIFFDRRV
jgi:uncharacterized glyoxalase superfamily protein PhnB